MPSRGQVQPRGRRPRAPSPELPPTRPLLSHGADAPDDDAALASLLCAITPPAPHDRDDRRILGAHEALMRAVDASRADGSW